MLHNVFNSLCLFVFLQFTKQFHRGFEAAHLSLCFPLSGCTTPKLRSFGLLSFPIHCIFFMLIQVVTFFLLVFEITFGFFIHLLSIYIVLGNGFWVFFVNLMVFFSWFFKWWNITCLGLLPSAPSFVFEIIIELENCDLLCFPVNKFWSCSFWRTEKSLIEWNLCLLYDGFRIF